MIIATALALALTASAGSAPGTGGPPAVVTSSTAVPRPMTATELDLVAHHPEQAKQAIVERDDLLVDCVEALRASSQPPPPPSTLHEVLRWTGLVAVLFGGGMSTQAALDGKPATVGLAIGAAGAAAAGLSFAIP